MSKFRSSPPKPKTDDVPREPLATEGENFERLQKVLASAGLGSRRACEELITSGRVDVDGVTMTKLGTKADPSLQVIRIDGEPLPKPKLRYFLVNKPLGVVTTNSDPAGRARVIDLVKSDARLFPVGRLDKSSEGLIIVTNDGELANLLAHPRYGVEKTYLALVAGEPGRDVLKQLTDGVHLAEGWAHAKSVRIRARQAHSSLLEIVLDEGRNREVRRLLARVGHKVLRLQRVAQGSLRLGNLSPGEYRPMTLDEVEKLKKAALESIQRGPKAKKPRKAKEIKKSIDVDVENEIENVEVNPLIDSSHSVTGAVISDETTPPPKSPRGRKPKSAAKPLIDLSVSSDEDDEPIDSMIEDDDDDNDSDEVMIFEEDDDDILVADHNDDADEDSEVDFFMQGFPGGVDAAVAEAQEEDEACRTSRGPVRGPAGGRGHGGREHGGRQSRGAREIRGGSRGDRDDRGGSAGRGGSADRGRGGFQGRSGGVSRGGSEGRERRPAARDGGGERRPFRAEGERRPASGGAKRFGGPRRDDRGGDRPFRGDRGGDQSTPRGGDAGVESRGGQGRDSENRGNGDRPRFGGSKFADRRKKFGNEKPFGSGRPGKRERAGFHSRDKSEGAGDSPRSSDQHDRNRSAPRPVKQREARPPRYDNRSGGRAAGRTTDQPARKPSDRSGPKKFGSKPFGERGGGDRKFGGRPTGPRPGGKRSFGEGRPSGPRKSGDSASSGPRKFEGKPSGPRKFGKPQGFRGGPKRFGKKKDEE